MCPGGTSASEAAGGVSGGFLTDFWFLAGFCCYLFFFFKPFRLCVW